MMATGSKMAVILRKATAR